MAEMEVILKAEKPLAVYNEFRAQLKELKAENEKVVFDYASPAGNKEARSHIYKLRLTKGAVEKARKAEKAASLAYGRLVDSEAKEITADIEDMIDAHEKPIKEIEQHEAERIQKHKDHIEGMRQVAAQTEHPDGRPLTANEYKNAISYLEEFNIDDMEEFSESAGVVRDEALVLARRHYSDRMRYESEQAELDRLRKESEERAEKEKAAAEARAKKEREEQLRREGEERARKEAEEKAAAEKAEAERAAKEAEAKRKSEQEAAARREAELKLEAEKAEREKAQAEKRAAQAEKDAEERAKRKAEEAKRKEAEALAKREADKKHRAKINNAALDALVAGGIDAAMARAVVTLIAEGKIPHVFIRY